MYYKFDSAGLGQSTFNRFAVPLFLWLRGNDMHVNKQF